ncbi:hypothetical protein V8F20_009588 [Naviculisporaceae sp. PSN 640]
MNSPPIFSYGSCSWHPEFCTFNEEFDPPTENRSPMEYPIDSCDTSDNVALNFAGHGPRERFHHAESIAETARKFMASNFGSGNGRGSIHQPDVVTAFCRQQLDPSTSRDGDAHERPVAFVYEWENKPSQSPTQRRTYPDPLSHGELLRKLSEVRFSVPAHARPSSENSNADADLRIIYINNLDPQMISILSRTTSRLQTAVIQRAIFQHLTARTSFLVHIATNGVKTFSMELSICYFRLKRRTDTARLNEFDRRRRWDNSRPLRSTLTPPTSPTEGVSTKHPLWKIYETHLAIAVTGVDQYRWTGWGISDDGWFEPEDTIWKYHHGKDSGSQPDPLSAGELEISPPERDPRKYFLKIFAIRIGIVATEWEFILYALQQEAHKAEGNPLLNSPEHAFQTKQGRERIRKLAAWNSEMITLVGTLLSSLSRMLVAWEVFQKTDVGYFIDKDNGSSCCGLASSPPADEGRHCHGSPNRPENSLMPMLHVIEKTFLSLEIVHGEMESLKESLEDQRRSLARGEENHSTFVQQRTGEDVKLLTWVTIAWYPVVIATGLCSAQEGTFPFKHNIWDFIASWLVVSSLVGLTIAVLLYRQGSSLMDWRILSSSVNAAPGLNKDSGSLTGPGDHTVEFTDRGRRRTTSFSTSTRALTQRSRQWTLGSRFSFGASIRSNVGLGLGARGREDYELAVLPNANSRRPPLRRVYHRSRTAVYDEPVSPHTTV